MQPQQPIDEQLSQLKIAARDKINELVDSSKQQFDSARNDPTNRYVMYYCKGFCCVTVDHVIVLHSSIFFVPFNIEVPVKDLFLKYFSTTYATEIRACVRISSIIRAILPRSLSANIIRNCHCESYVVVRNQNALINTSELHRHFNVIFDVVT